MRKKEQTKLNSFILWLILLMQVQCFMKKDILLSPISSATRILTTYLINIVENGMGILYNSERYLFQCVKAKIN